MAREKGDRPPLCPGAREQSAIAVAAGLAVFLATTSASAGEVAEGRRLAAQHCARCHVVSEDNRYGGIGSTPSFRLLAKAFPDWRTRFETFYARRPHPAFLAIEGRGRLRADLPANAHPVVLPASAIDDLVALAEHIRAQPDPRPASDVR